jgi:hypothetical protein
MKSEEKGKNASVDKNNAFLGYICDLPKIDTFIQHSLHLPGTY